MVETKDFSGTFSPATHLVAEVVGWQKDKQQLIVQTYNLSGEKDGPPMAENFEDLWILPKSTDKLVLEDKLIMPSYNKNAMAVEVQPVITTPENKTATRQKRKSASKKNEKKNTAAQNKKKPAKKKQKKLQNKKSLDRVTTTSSSELEEGAQELYTLAKVLKSFEDPRCDLFINSLKAELTKFPELSEITLEDVERDPPDILFGGRRKGYFKCPRLCRVFVLTIFRWLRTRGEWFVKWINKATGKTYDGTKVLAHAFTIKYCSMHKPAMSVIFSKRGHLKSTNTQFTRLKRQYLPPPRRLKSQYLPPPRT